MTAVTVKYENFFPKPGMEVINCDVAADGDTYISKQLKTIKAAAFQPNEATDAADSWGVTFSGSTATISLTSLSSINGTLILYG